MTSQILIGVLLAAMSALIGAVVQMYRQRSRLYTIVSAVSGDSFDNTELADIPEDAVRQLDLSQYFPSAVVSTTLGFIDLIIRRADNLVDGGPRLYSALDIAVETLNDESSTNQEIMASLRPALEQILFDDFVVGLLYDRAGFQFHEPEAGPIDELGVNWVEDEDGGFEIDLPGGPLRFASHLDGSPALRARLEPFVTALRQLDRVSLRDFYQNLRTRLEAEGTHSELIRTYLRPLRELRSRWMVTVYVANYGPTAAYLKPIGRMVESFPERRNPIVESCWLVTPHEVSGWDRAYNGVMIEPGTVVEVGYMTERSQEAMGDHGSELRQHFKDKRGSVHVELDFVGTGIRTSRVATTEGIDFLDPDFAADTSL